jgi:hypothetical protein
MRQRTFASQAGYQKYGRKSRRELFLDEMECIVPWSAMCLLVEPHYPKAGNGRRTLGLEIMPRTYFLQHWFNLSNPGVDKALYESPVLQRFTGVDLGAAPAPDETTRSAPRLALSPLSAGHRHATLSIARPHRGLRPRRYERSFEGDQPLGRELLKRVHTTG